MRIKIQIRFSKISNKLVFLLIFFIPVSIQAISSSKKIDSLENIFKSSELKRQKVEILQELIPLWDEIDSIRAFKYFERAIKLAEKEHLDFMESNSFVYLIKYYEINLKSDKRKLLRLKQGLKYAQKNSLTKGIGFAYSAIGRQFLIMDNYDSSLFYQQLALKHFKTINYNYGIALAYERTGVVYMIKNEYLKALKYYFQSLSINISLHLKHETGITLYHIGLTNFYLSNYDESIKYIIKSLKYWDELKEPANIWNCNELIGNIYIRMGNHAKALRYHKKALQLRKKNIKDDLAKGISRDINSDLGLAYSYNNIAEVYLNLKQYDSAYFYAIKSYKIKTKKNSFASINDMANSQVNLGKIYCNTGNFDSAVYMLTEAAKTYKAIQNTSAYAGVMYALGLLNEKQKKYKKARHYYKMGVEAAKKVNDKYNIVDGYNKLSHLHSLIGDYKNSLNYLKLYNQIKDSIINREKNNIIAELEIKYNVQKKEQKILHQKETIKQKKKQIYLIIVIAVILFVFLLFVIVFIIINKRQKEKLLIAKNENLQKEIELKNKDLVCNVSKIYAKNQVINRVAHSLINSSPDFKQTNKKLVKDIVNELKQSLDETGWKEFEMRFAKVHENFYKELDRRFPNLTKTERKLCALIKLGMSSKEIASITMIRSESVDTARSRLRKKLGLTNDVNLFDFLKNI